MNMDKSSRKLTGAILILVFVFLNAALYATGTKTNGNNAASRTQIVDAGVPVIITVYNLQGELLRTITMSTREFQNAVTLWDGRDESGQVCGGGVYVLKLKSGQSVSTLKMILMK